MRGLPMKASKGDSRTLSVEFMMKALKAQGVFETSFTNNPAVSLEIRDGEKLFIKFSNV